MFSYITDIDIKVPYNSVFEKATDIKEIRINWTRKRALCSDCVCGCASQRRQPIDERTRSRGRCYQSLISQSPSSWAESKGTVLICKSIYGDGHCLGPTENTRWTVLDYRRFRCSGCKLGYKHHRFVTTNRHKHKQVVYTTHIACNADDCTKHLHAGCVCQLRSLYRSRPTRRQLFWRQNYVPRCRGTFSLLYVCMCCGSRIIRWRLFA